MALEGLLVSVATVILILLVVFFTFRMVSDRTFSTTSVTYVENERVQQRMVHVKSPFHMSIKDSKNGSLKDGIWIQISSSCDFKLRCYWGVSRDLFHSCTVVPWLNLNESVTDGSFWQDGTLMQGDLETYAPCEAKRFHVKPPSTVKPEELGQAPRQRIPLVVILMKVHISCNCLDTDVVALLSSVHIKDEMVSMSTSILEQYLKVASGQTCLLQKLYVPTGERAEPGEDCRVPCVVCQVAPVTCALLPCRHTCVCESCFKELVTCPMCRSRIVTFFKVDSALNQCGQPPASEASDRTSGQREGKES